MGTKIHPSAIVDASANLGDGVEIGPYCVVGADVSLGEGTRLLSHVVVSGFTTIGRECEIHPFASVGGKTQDLKYKGGRPGLTIGDKTVIRESVTLNCATNDGGFTRLGSGCLIMAYSHLGHDCQVGDGVIIANCGTLAGHVVIHDHAIVGGVTGVHQFCTIGKMSIIGGCSKVVKDIPPFMMADGNPLEVHGINKIGLARKGISEESQKALKEAYRIIYRENLLTAKALEKIRSELDQTPEVVELVGFVEKSERGITR